MPFLAKISVFLAAVFCLSLTADRVAAQAATTRPLVEPDVATGADLARLDESAINVVLHVDPAAVTGDGSAEKPFPTLAAAFSAAEKSLAAGKPTKVMLAAGVYREDPVRIAFDGQARDTLFVVEGAGRDDTILSGSDVWPAQGWTDHGGGLYSHDWPNDWGHFAYNWGPPETLGHRREMVFVDGWLLRQVEIERFRYEGRVEPWETLTMDNPNPPRRWVYAGFDDPTTNPTPCRRARSASPSGTRTATACSSACPRAGRSATSKSRSAFAASYSSLARRMVSCSAASASATP